MSEFNGLSDEELEEVKKQLLHSFGEASKGADKDYGERSALWTRSQAELGQTLIRLDEHAMYRKSEKNSSPS